MTTQTLWPPPRRRFIGADLKPRGSPARLSAQSGLNRSQLFPALAEDYRYFRMTTQALWPPNPNELLTAYW
jgi:lambda repressor-like predicted transcriptional regulator